MKTTQHEQEEVMAVATLKGSCFCGAVEIEAIGALPGLAFKPVMHLNYAEAVGR
jgi:hypothetical protein